MLALILLALAPLMILGGQCAILATAGLPLRWRISSSDLPRSVKRANRVLLNAVLASVLLAYPLLRGESIVGYYARFFPLDCGPIDLLRGAAASVLYLALLYGAWVATDNVRCNVRHSPATLTRRLAAVPLMSIAAATLEELLFRAVLLAGLLESFPTAIAMALGILIFAAAHYVRSVKRYWTFPGHVALGGLFCVAFLCTRTLWLPIGLHAGGILVLMGIRPFARYAGPSWLVGASIFPYAGVVGIFALGLLTANVWLTYGVAR